MRFRREIASSTPGNNWRCELKRCVRPAHGAALLLTGLWWGCAAEGAPAFDAGRPTASFGGASGNVGAGGRNISIPPMEPLPPEEEEEETYYLPVQSGRFIWSANPRSGNVSVIDAETLTVTLAPAGFGPTYLAALPGREDGSGAAVVLNTLGQDAAVLRLKDEQLRVERAPTHAGANSWTISPDGQFAIAWSNAAAEKSADPADSYQDLTVLDLRTDKPRATRATAGYRPSRIFFDAASQRAFVVSAPSISVIDLRADEPSVVQDVPLSDDPSLVALDVAVLPDGSAAVYRVEGQAYVVRVDLETGARTQLDVSGPITDLDLVADGTSAIAVVRGRLRSARPSGGEGGASASGGATGSAGAAGADVRGGADAGGEAGSAVAGGNGGNGGDPGDFARGGTVAFAGATSTGDDGTEAPANAYGPSEVFLLDLRAATARVSQVEVQDLVGSVSVAPNGSRAVLYTTATPLERVTILDTNPQSDAYLTQRAVLVRAPVDAVFVAPDGEHAVVALNAQDVKGAFGVVPLAAPLPVRIQTTDARVSGVAFGRAPTHSAIVTAKTGQTAYVVRMPALQVSAVPLPSLPIAAGIMTDANVGYVAQQHPEGRLTVIQLDTAEARTLTGFELGGGE